MADPNDEAVDRAISRLEEAVKELRASQQRDDEAEGDTPLEEQPKTLSDAKVRVREHFRRRRSAQEQ